MTSLADEIREILAAEAAEALAAGWAEVREEEREIGLTLYLEPMKLAAAPLEVYFDSDQLLVCSPGRNDMVCEFFSEDREEIKRQVRALTQAVVKGRYAERLQEGTTEIVAEWPGPDGREQAKRSLLAMRSSGRESWRAVAYEPYS
ncbi:MAG TPA: hypothetical protein VLC07_09790 [Solirubrobacterales bacterium]|nr:hypothetical protein [Solirubrobacterales bacterium]